MRIVRTRISFVEVLEAKRLLSAATQHLVFVTHGWNSQAAGWPTDMQANIADQIGLHRTDESMEVHRLSWNAQQAELSHPIPTADVDELWEVVAYDWSENADTFFPTSAADNAADIGIRIGAELAKQSYETVHLIAHSAGAWMINAMIDQIELSTPTTWTHATFLDAFTPSNSHLVFGATADFAEHYIYDGVLPTTNENFVNALNIDVTRLGPSLGADLASFGVAGHAWPWEWYLETIMDPFSSDAHGQGFVNSIVIRNDEPIEFFRGAAIVIGLTGDATDDGRFDSSDFIEVFKVAKYESGEAATWQEGDWNNDGLFDSADLIRAFQDGGYLG